MAWVWGGEGVVLRNLVNFMKNSFVAFFDILGFKNLVEKNSHEDLMEMYEFSINKAIGLAEDVSNSIFKVLIPNEHKNFLQVKIYIISDSIILVQEEMTELGLMSLLHYSQCILGLFMADGIPARGAISFGQITIQENKGTTIFGLGLTKAYNLEAKQEWSGCIIDKECFDVALNLNPSFIENLLQHSIITKFNVPIKDGVLIDQYVVDWTLYNLKNGAEDVRIAFSKNKKEINDSVSVKIENTLHFYNTIIKKQPSSL